MDGGTPGASERIRFNSPYSVRNFIRVMYDWSFQVSSDAFEMTIEHFGRRGVDLDVVDHEVSWSVYFQDSDGNSYEMTPYEQEKFSSPSGARTKSMAGCVSGPALGGRAPDPRNKLVCKNAVRYRRSSLSANARNARAFLTSPGFLSVAEAAWFQGCVCPLVQLHHVEAHWQRRPSPPSWLATFRRISGWVGWAEEGDV